MTRKNFYKSSTPFFALYCILLLPLSAAYPKNTTNAEDIFTIATQSRFPFYYKNNQGKLIGTFAGLIDCTMDNLKQKYKISLYPWARASSLVKENKEHGLCLATQNADRDSWGEISSSFFYLKWSWVSLKPIKPKSKDFHTKKFGAKIKSARLRYLKSKFKNVHSTPEALNTLRMLNAGRFDVALMNNVLMARLSEKPEFSLSRYSIQEFDSKPMGCYMNKAYLKKNPEFMKNFNRALRRCRIGFSSQ